ncbi:hypothetical protein ROHU_023424 [Labeo rohita]|nr:hypothetical protein ROHU_023424 [Labeo rohita]
MATMSKVLNLKDNEMDDLADFLGHDIRVHQQYYRLPEGKNNKKLQPIDKDLEEPHTLKRSSQTPQRKWSNEEIQAVEKTLMDFIRSGKVPGKAQCMECI